ncbi:MAG: hypothetical protein PVJ57_19765 [Phycisphaerae bacterium]|jgi:hypothetical protein
MKRKRRSWTRRIVWAATAGLVVLTALYWHLTSPARLRARVLQAFASFPGAVRIGSVSFSPWQGLELVELELVLANEDQPEEKRQPRLRAARAVIHVAPWALIGGEVRPESVTLDGLEVSLVGRVHGTGADEDVSLEDRDGGWRLPSLKTLDLPRLRFDQADVLLWADTGGKTRLLRRWLLTARGNPTLAGYDLRLDAAGGGGNSLAQLSWDRASGRIRAELDWLDLDMATLFLPQKLTDLRRKLHLRGRVRVEHALLHEAASPKEGWVADELRLRIADGRCAMPIEQPDDAWPASRRFLHLGDADIAVTYDRGPGASPGAVVVSGTGQLNGAPAEFTLSATSAALTGQPGEASGILAAKLRVQGFRLPTVDEQPDFVGSPRLPEPVRAFFAEYRPRGRVDLAMTARRETDGRLVATGELVPLGVSCRYYRFPYEFRDARGLVRFTGEQVLFEGLSARHGSCWIYGDGHLDSARRNTGFELTFRAAAVPLDADLFAAVPERYQRLWQQAGPLGVCDARVHLVRPGAPPVGNAAPTDVRVDARLLGGSMLIGQGRRLQQADGRLTIAAGAIEVDELRGLLDGSPVCLSGAVGLDNGASRTQLAVTAANVPVSFDEAAGGGEGTDAFRLVGRGRADVWGEVSGTGDESDEATRWIVHVKEGTVRGSEAAEGWQDCTGWIRLVGPRREVTAFEARQGDASLQVQGELPRSAATDGPVSLDVRAQGVACDGLAEQLGSRRWARVAEALGLSGRGTIQVLLRPAPSESGSERQAVEVELTADGAKPAPLPLDLKEPAVRARVTGEAVDILSATATHGADGKITGSGHLVWSGDEPRGEFRMSAEGLDVTPELIDVLPGRAADLLRRLAPQGRVRLDLDRVRLGERDGETWEFVGTLDVAAGRLDLGLPLTDFDGRLRGTCRVLADGEVELDADLELDRGQLSGRPLVGWAGHLRREAGARFITLEDLRGELCGGDALAEVRIDPERSSYELSLTIQRVAFGDLLPTKPGSEGRRRGGQTDGSLHLRGLAGDPESRNGAGNLRIRGASFLHTPVLAEVAEASREAARRVDDEYDLAELRFVWRGSVLELTRVELESRNLRLVGEGTWNMETDALDLTLLGAHPEHWPRVAVLTDLLEVAGQELVQYRVQGTAAAPRVTVEPLHGLNRTLQLLLLGEKAR